MDNDKDTLFDKFWDDVAKAFAKFNEEVSKVLTENKDKNEVEQDGK